MDILGGLVYSTSVHYSTCMNGRRTQTIDRTKEKEKKYHEPKCTRNRAHITTTQKMFESQYSREALDVFRPLQHVLHRARRSFPDLQQSTVAPGGG